MKSLIKAVTQLTGVDILNPSRKREFVEARSLYFTVYRKSFPDATYFEIGKSINKDHATVIHSIKEFETHLKANPSLAIHERNLLINFSNLNEDDFNKIDEIERLKSIIYQQQAEIDTFKLVKTNTIGSRIDNLINNSQNATVLVERMEAFLKMNS